MDWFVFIISFLIVLSKFFDCWSTAIRITHPGQEKNPIARSWFMRFGTNKVIWLIFVFTLLLVAITLMLLYAFYDNTLSKLLFCSVGSIVICAQFAVAHTNYTSKLKPITRIILRR